MCGHSRQLVIGGGILAEILTHNKRNVSLPSRSWTRVKAGVYAERSIYFNFTLHPLIKQTPSDFYFLRSLFYSPNPFCRKGRGTQKKSDFNFGNEPTADASHFRNKSESDGKKRVSKRKRFVLPTNSGAVGSNPAPLFAEPLHLRTVIALIL
ncbi:hypothetical protein CEXT_685201 [Caerostris extrusa]|uniref:Uncharacterized protein n=1 Tax=Caerostris extrusa TaxID=172846 RepID=A0AAV4Q595_CAEEX|nr:hypothetical protein CEXT_685201 [Caerostris extrusa]